VEADTNTNRTADGSDLTGYIQVGKGKNSVAVNPNNGTMAGVCLSVAKDARKMSVFSVMSKAERFKVQSSWYELDGTVLKWCSGSKERDPADLKPLVPMAKYIHSTINSFHILYSFDL
jgi:hypothetical protein